MLYPPRAGVRWPSVDTHCARTLSQSTRTVFLHPEVLQTCVNHKWSRPFIKTKLGFFPQKCPVNGIHGNSQRVQGGAREFCIFFSSLRVNGDNFTATASHQEDPVQTLHENLQELHV